MDQMEITLRKARRASCVAEWEARIGKSQLLRYLDGEHVTGSERVKAKCYDCMGGYPGGEEKDCLVVECPLYPLQPYLQANSLEKNSSRRNLKSG